MAYEGLHAGCSNVCVATCGWAGAFTSPTAKPETDNVGIQEAFAAHPELYDVWAQHVHGSFARFAEALDGGFAALTTVFQGLDYDGAVYSRGLRHLLRFRGTSQALPGGLVLAGWDDGLDADGGWTVRIATDATRAELCDHMGNRSPARIDGGAVTFAVGRNPQALLLFGATGAEAAETALSVSVKRPEAASASL